MLRGDLVILESLVYGSVCVPCYRTVLPLLSLWTYGPMDPPP